MSVDMKVKAIYDSEISNITRSEKNWKDVLKVAGQLYRYEFDNIVMVTAQRSPEKSTLMADYDTWKKVGRYVKRGAKGCAIFPSRALNPRMRYIFDISDTGGKNVKLTWDLEGENLKSYADFLVSEGQMERYKSDDRESLKNTLKQFTGTNVWDIIKEEFGDRMSELMQLSGSVIKEFNEKRKGLQQDSDMEQLVYSSVMYAVGTRCGFDLSVQEQDFSQIVNIKDEEIVYRLGSLVCDVSCSVLREFSRNLQTIESERRISYVRSNDLQGSGRTAVSGADNAGRDRGFNEAGQIRENGNEVSSGERTGKVQDTDEIREDVREDVGSRGGSKPALRPVGGTVSNEAQATESIIDNGDVEDKRAGEDAGRGSSAPPDRDEVSLEIQEELNRELDEINSLGVSKEAEYTQASFFFDQNGQASFGVKQSEKTRHNEFMRQYEEDRKTALAGKYNYLNPKKAESVPSEYVKQILMRGTGFVGGKGRVCEIYRTEIDAGTRAKRIKAEYGQGGASWPLDGLGLHGYDTFHGSGLRIQWKDQDGEVEGYVSWKNVEKEIGVLILTGEYQSETPRIDELAMDGLREDDEVIDAEYREVDTQEEKSEIDDYAIPDEPDSYAVNRKAAELRYIKPIDYADRVAAMDEDLRDAIEILVSECSCYTPFRAFLMDVVQSDFAFMPNKLELICEIAMGNVQGEQFHDHSYGFRPNRCAQQAILTALEMMNDGNEWIVDIDLEKFFDTVNHDKLMTIIGRTIKDGDVISIVRKYLVSGIMIDDEYEDSIVGTPQGGNLSPLLANIMLNELDKEMEKRGLNFVRYADDCIIMVGSEMSANRVMRNISRFIEKKLGLKVNMSKSKVDKPQGLKYLGFGFYFDSRAHQFKAKPHAKSVAKFKKRMKEFTCRSWGVSNSYKVEKLNQLIRGWINYFKIGNMKTLCKQLDSNIRYRLRMCIWKQWKTPQNRAKNLIKLGINKYTAWKVAYAGDRIAYVCNKGAVNVAISNERLTRFGLVSMMDYYAERCVTC